MRTIGIFDAKSRLSELIESGEIVTITKHGHPVATLTPIKPEARAVVARIRANPCVRSTSADIATMLREGRR